MNLIDINNYAEIINNTENVKYKIIICPSFTDIKDAREVFAPKISICGQDISSKPSGAFTSQISGAMLNKCRADYVMIGHSEVRDAYNQNDNEIINKIKMATENNLQIIYCFGEDLPTRKNSTYLEYIKKQISVFDGNNLHNIILAYEPIWSIGTGIVPKNIEIEEVIESIYTLFNKTNIKILYGGSVNQENYKAILQIPTIAGLLIGNFSRDPQNIKAILED